MHITPCTMPTLRTSMSRQFLVHTIWFFPAPPNWYFLLVCCKSMSARTEKASRLDVRRDAAYPARCYTKSASNDKIGTIWRHDLKGTIGKEKKEERWTYLSHILAMNPVDGLCSLKLCLRATLAGSLRLFWAVKPSKRPWDDYFSSHS